MTTNPQMLASLAELKEMALSPTDTAAVQLYLIVQNFVRSEAARGINSRFEDWSVAEICRVMKIKVPS